MAKVREVDENIVDELEKLPKSFNHKSGMTIIFSSNDRYGIRFNHIANKKHGLTVRDIKIVKSIIENPFKQTGPSKKDKSMCLYGKRKGVNKKHFLKIVIDTRQQGLGKIVTIYPTKKIK